MDSFKFSNAENLMVKLQSADKNERNTAETTVEKMFENYSSLIIVRLCELMNNSKNLEAKIMAPILLRQYLFSKKEIYKKLDQQSINTIKTQCINTFKEEQSEPVRRVNLKLIIDIAENDIPERKWTDLPVLLEKFCKSSNENVRGEAFLLLSEVANMIDLNENDKMAFKNIIKNGMNDSVSSVQLKSLEALVVCNDMLDPNDHDTIKKILGLISQASILKNNSKAEELFELLIDLISTNPDLVKNHFELFFKPVSSICLSKNFSDSVRVLALESLVVLAEQDTGIYRSSEPFVRSCFMSAFALMLENHNDPEWVNDLKEEIEDTEIFTEGELAMDRFAHAFGSDRTIQVLIPLIQSFLQNDDWNKRMAALLTISQISEAVDNHHFDTFVRVVLNYINDKSVRVQFSAIHCIGQMSEDFSPEIEEKSHSLILPALVKTLKNSEVTRIKSHAAAALVNFVENSREEIMTPYLNDFLPILYHFTQNSHQIVKVQVITVVSLIASCTPKEYLKKLSEFVPILLTIFTKSTQPQEIVLRSKSLEALTFIGIELPPKDFAPVAKKLMDITIKEASHLLTSTSYDSTDYLDFILQSWIRNAKSLKTDFSPFLSPVMECIIKTIENDSDGIPEEDIDRINSQSDSEDYCPNENKFNEIESAVGAMAKIPEYAGLKFLPYLKKSVEIVTNFLNYWGGENIQINAAYSLSSLFSVVSLGFENNQIRKEEAIQCLSKFISELLNQYDEEIEHIVKKRFLESIIKILNQNELLTYTYLTSGTNEDDLIKKLYLNIQDYEQNALEIEKKANNSENDNEQIERYKSLNEVETELIYLLAEIFGIVLKMKKESIPKTLSPLIDELISIMSKKEANIHIKKILLLLLVEIIDNMPIAIKKYSDLILDMFINYMNSNDIDLRKTSISGLGLFSQKFTETFSKKKAQILKTLLDQNNLLKNKKDEHLVSIKEKIAGAYGRIIFSLSNEIDLSESFPHWIEMLPVSKDKKESVFVNEVLFNAIGTWNEKILGKNLKFLPVILNFISLGAKNNKLDDKKLNILRSFKSKLKDIPIDIQKNLASNLTTDSKNMITNLK